MGISFAKMQGVGNDFVLIDSRTQGERDWSALALAICDRRFGVGADGLLVVVPSDSADARMRMFNPDGTEDMCGNGLRCVARYVAEGAGAPPPGSSRDLTLETLVGMRRAALTWDAQSRCRITVEMGEPLFAPEEIPLRLPAPDGPILPLSLDGETLSLLPLFTGSTHTVIFALSLPEDDRFLRLSPQIETHPLFPERTSVLWTQVLTPDRLRIRIWERGVGETWGCGTGACAAAVAAQLQGYAGAQVTVESRGGELEICWTPGESMRLTGPAEYVFTGCLPVP